MTILGPRQINYRTKSGTHGTIILQVELKGDASVDIDGDSLSRKIGSIQIECDLFNKTMNFEGEDDLQLMMRLLWLSDTWLRKVCRDNSISIYKWEEGDIEGDLTVYKP